MSERLKIAQNKSLIYVLDVWIIPTKTNAKNIDYTLRLEAIDQSQSTAHRSMLECVYVWKRPREKVS